MVADKDGAGLDWGTRLRLAVGMAKGLAYLHEDCVILLPLWFIFSCLHMSTDLGILIIVIVGSPRIIHRDIKAANILIDNNFEAMVLIIIIIIIIYYIYTYVGKSRKKH